MAKMTLLLAFLAFAGTVTLIHPPVAHGCGFDPRALNACADRENQEMGVCNYLYITGWIDAQRICGLQSLSRPGLLRLHYPHSLYGDC